MSLRRSRAEIENASALSVPQPGPLPENMLASLDDLYDLYNESPMYVRFEYMSVDQVVRTGREWSYMCSLHEKEKKRTRIFRTWSQFATLNRHLRTVQRYKPPVQLSRLLFTSRGALEKRIAWIRAFVIALDPRNPLVEDFARPTEMDKIIEASMFSTDPVHESVKDPLPPRRSKSLNTIQFVAATPAKSDASHVFDDVSNSKTLSEQPSSAPASPGRPNVASRRLSGDTLVDKVQPSPQRNRRRGSIRSLLFRFTSRKTRQDKSANIRFSQVAAGFLKGDPNEQAYKERKSQRKSSKGTTLQDKSDKETRKDKQNPDKELESPTDPKTWWKGLPELPIGAIIYEQSPDDAEVSMPSKPKKRTQSAIVRDLGKRDYSMDPPPLPNQPQESKRKSRHKRYSSDDRAVLRRASRKSSGKGTARSRSQERPPQAKKPFEPISAKASSVSSSATSLAPLSATLELPVSPAKESFASKVPDHAQKNPQEDTERATRAQIGISRSLESAFEIVRNRRLQQPPSDKRPVTANIEELVNSILRDTVDDLNLPSTSVADVSLQKVADDVEARVLENPPITVQSSNDEEDKNQISGVSSGSEDPVTEDSSEKVANELKSSDPSASSHEKLDGSSVTPPTTVQDMELESVPKKEASTEQFSTEQESSETVDAESTSKHTQPPLESPKKRTVNLPASNANKSFKAAFARFEALTAESALQRKADLQTKGKRQPSWFVSPT